MKRVILLSFICFTFLSFQSELHAQFNFGLQAGVNIGSITSKFDDEKETAGGHIGIRLGLVAERPINEKITLHSGIIYSQKGGKTTENEGDESSTSKITINYLDLPILLKYNVGKGYIMGGVTVGYALSGKTSWKYTYMGESDSGSDDLDIGSSDSDDFGKLDAGITVGIGYPLNIANYPIVLNAYYTYGILDIAAIEEGNVTTGTIGIGATYFFNSDKSASTKPKKKTSSPSSNESETEEVEEEW